MEYLLYTRPYFVTILKLKNVRRSLLKNGLLLEAPLYKIFNAIKERNKVQCPKISLFLKITFYIINYN